MEGANNRQWPVVLSQEAEVTQVEPSTGHANPQLTLVRRYPTQDSEDEAVCMHAHACVSVIAHVCAYARVCATRVCVALEILTIFFFAAFE